MSHSDSFTGAWIFDREKSKLSTSHPQGWTQQIVVTEDEIRVREEIVRLDGPQIVVTVDARFDGKEYPVSGSPAADTIAYTRVGSSIAGTGRKNGSISLRETITGDSEGETLTLTYSLFMGAREVASGVAVFRKDTEGR